MCLILTSITYLNAGKKIDVSNERAYMSTEREEYFTDMLDHLNEYHDCHGQRLSSKNLKEAVLCVMEQEEEEIECSINNIKCDASFQSSVDMNVQNKDANWSLERRIASVVLAEMVENFKGCTIQSDKHVPQNQ